MRKSGGMRKISSKGPNEKLELKKRLTFSILLTFEEMREKSEDLGL